MATEERLRVIEQLASKLRHPLAEVRGRALDNLSFKLKHGIFKVDDIAADRTIPAALLSGLAHCDSWPTTTATLVLLRNLATSHAGARVLLEAGAERALGACREACPPELTTQVDSTLTALFTLGVNQVRAIQAHRCTLPAGLLDPLVYTSLLVWRACRCKQRE